METTISKRDSEARHMAPFLTPTPWAYESARRLILVGDGIVVCGMYGDQFVTEANAAFIVRACNSHDELVAACEAAIGHGYCENTSPAASFDYVPKSAIAKLRAAIARAREGGK